MFTDAVQMSSDSENLQPYALFYAIPITLPIKSRSKVVGSNIWELHELVFGLFGKVILAETVALSGKDLGVSESDDDKRQVNVQVLQSPQKKWRVYGERRSQPCSTFKSSKHWAQLIQSLGSRFKLKPATSFIWPHRVLWSILQKTTLSKHHETAL